MFKRKKQLAQALALLQEALAALRDSSTLNAAITKTAADAKALLDQSITNADAWRKRYETTQNGPDEALVASVLTLNPPHCRWVN